MGTGGGPFPFQPSRAVGSRRPPRGMSPQDGTQSKVALPLFHRNKFFLCKLVRRNEEAPPTSRSTGLTHSLVILCIYHSATRSTSHVLSFLRGRASTVARLEPAPGLLLRGHRPREDVADAGPV